MNQALTTSPPLSSLHAPHRKLFGIRRASEPQSVNSFSLSEPRGGARLSWPNVQSYLRPGRSHQTSRAYPNPLRSFLGLNPEPCPVTVLFAGGKPSVPSPATNRRARPNYADEHRLAQPVWCQNRAQTLKATVRRARIKSWLHRSAVPHPAQRPATPD